MPRPQSGAPPSPSSWRKYANPAPSARAPRAGPSPRRRRPVYPGPMLDRTANTPPLPPEIARRRTFAIISHPDAGKTTLTEKFLLYGGAIQIAGQVRAKGEARRTRSDFMKLEQERGISVSASAMSFPFRDWWFNLVDTPGHSDFSEDTYRTLTAVDAAVMVIDGAKGVESQTRKLFEVCRLRDLPILTFCNKMDREARDTFEIIDEIQHELQLDVCPASWPIGQGRDFLGCYDMLHDRLELMDRADRNRRAESISMQGLDDPAMEEHIPAPLLATLREEVAMARALLPAFDHAGDARRQPLADLVRLGDQLLRRAGAHGRHRRIRPPARGPRRRAARRRRLGAGGHRLRLQGPGQHGPQAPRPRRLRPPLLRPLPARDEAPPRPHGKPMAVGEPGPLPRPGPRARRGRLGRRHHRHPQPRPAPHRRRPDRRRGDPLHRHPLLRPRAPAVGARRRPDEGQAPREGAEPVRRGGRLQALQAPGRLRLDRRRRRPPAVRRPRLAASSRNTASPSASSRPSSPPPAGSPARASGSRPSPRRTRATWPRTTTATRST